jgi:hypothetical protein
MTEIRPIAQCAAQLRDGGQLPEADTRAAAIVATRRTYCRGGEEGTGRVLEGVAAWSGLPAERTFNEVIPPAILSDELISPAEEDCLSGILLANYRVCEAAARSRGRLAEHVPPELLEGIADAGELYR